jgi:hypothetical protein
MSLSKETLMKKSGTIPFNHAAVFTLAEIKAAATAFDRGESNVFEALDAIVVAMEAYRAARKAAGHRGRRRDAA